MIKTVTVAICDICGHVERAKETQGRYNETAYELPPGWAEGATGSVHMCPNCYEKLSERVKTD